MGSSIQEKQQALFASLFRYTPEAIPLRQRALDRVVLAALVNSTEEAPMRSSAIERAIGVAGKTPALRPEVVRDTLDRLVVQGKAIRVKTTEGSRKKTLEVNAYYLSPAGDGELNKIIGSGSQLLDTVLQKMVRETDHLISPDKATTICRDFIFECAAKFGRQMAQSVVGRWNGEELVKSIDISTLLKNITGQEKLQSDVLELIEARCTEFLRSTDPKEEELKFDLTQTFYFCQLLGFDYGQFDPLAKEAFTESAFYLDTNVLLHGLVTQEDSAKLFKELISVCGHLGVELRVTRATIDEARRAAANRESHLRQIDGNVPIELIQHTKDDFISSFYEARGANPEISVEAFFEQFEKLDEVLSRFGIGIDDRTASEILATRKFEREVEVVQQETLTVRRTEKPEGVMLHDIAHYALVTDQRAKGSKVWFLTVDRALLQAAIKLALGKTPFCFSLPGFLQSISPFVSNAERRSLVEVFSSVLTEQISTGEGLFDSQELTVLAHMQEDILTTPPDKIANAFEHMRRTVLKGSPPKEGDTQILVLELKKYFVSSTNEREKEFGVKLSRLEQETVAERRAKEESERKRHEASLRARELENENENLRGTVLDTSQANLTIANRLDKNQQYQRVAIGVFGVVLGALLAVFQNSIKLAALTRWPQLLPGAVDIAVSLLGMLIMVAPLVYCIRKSRQPPELRIGLSALVILIGMVTFRFFSDDSISLLASFIEVAVLIAVVAIFFNTGRDSVK